MKYVKEGSIFMHCECENCKQTIKVGTSECKKTADGFTVSPPARCSNCNQISSTITYKADPITDNDYLIKCPKCRSTQITGNNKGFGLGKAAAGGLLLGPVGLLGGFVGSKKVMISCMRCGNRWKAGS